MHKKTVFIVGAFFDGRPGHEKQTSGILEELKKKRAIKIVSTTVQKGNVFQQSISWIKHFSSIKSKKKTSLAECNLFIGTGTHTHLPMLSQKKHFNIPVVTCMTPATIIQDKFDLIFAPQHDNIGNQKNVFRTIGPPNLNHVKGEHLSHRTLVLIGGVDPQSHHWVNEEIITSVKRLICHENGQEIIISSSPRTPKETVESLSLIADEYQNATFYDYRDTPSGWVEKEYSLCQQVWVTGDSISMVYEALSSGCKVGIIPVRWRRKHSKFITSEKYLYENEMVINLDAYLAHEKNWKNKPALNEAGRCAEEIINRFL